MTTKGTDPTRPIAIGLSRQEAELLQLALNQPQQYVKRLRESIELRDTRLLVLTKIANVLKHTGGDV